MPSSSILLTLASVIATVALTGDPNDAPHPRGDGPSEQGAPTDALTDDPVREKNNRRLAKEKTLCLDVEKARRAIVDESFEPYFSQLQRAEIAALTAAVPTDETLDGCRREARQRFQDAVRPFTDREAEALSYLAMKLQSRVSNDYPLLARQPFQFIKTANHLCGGFAWTRGLCIVLSQQHVEEILAARMTEPLAEFLEHHGPLLVHEQMHVLQRVYPRRFVGLYTDVFGFTQARVEPSSWLTERQITNPDAVRLRWIFATDRSDEPKKYVWPRTILKTIDGVPRMGWDFQLLAVEVEKRATHWQVKSQPDGTPMHDREAISILARRFPVKNGLDHPNEIAAYMLPRLVFGTTKVGDPGNGAVASDPTDRANVERRFADWCQANLQ